MLISILDKTPYFKGRPKLKKFLKRLLGLKGTRIARLPGGMNILCNLENGFEESLWYEIKDSPVLEIFRKILKPGDTFIDCGAHIGTYSLYAATVVGEEGEIFAIEAHPSTYKKLVGNFNLNKNRNFIHYNAAVGSTQGMINFYCDKNPDSSRVIYTEKENSSTVYIKSLDLDSIITKTFTGGIKLDVEGNEYEALLGAKHTITTNRPWLIIEYNSKILGNIRLKDWNVHQFLTALKYTPYLCSSVSGDKMIPLANNWSSHDLITDIFYYCKKF